MLDLKEVPKILVIRFSSLGDILLTTPFLRSLQKKYPNSKIDFFVKTNFIDAITLNPNVDSVFSWQTEEEFINVRKKLEVNNYDLVIDLQNNFRSKKTVKLLGKKSYSFQKPNVKKFLLVNTKLNLLKEKKTIPQRYIDVFPELKLDGEGLELFLPEKVEGKLDNKENIIGMAPGAFHFTKRWPIEYYAELGNKFVNDGYSIAIFGGKSDREICSDLHNRIKESLDLSNDNNLFETASYMKKCKFVVCNDSGLMHTATSVGVPVVSIFGSTVQEFGFAPFGVKNLIIEKNDLSCRPCSHIGKAKCKKKHFKCMKDLTPNLVYNETKKFAEEL